MTSYLFASSADGRIPKFEMLNRMTEVIKVDTVDDEGAWSLFSKFSIGTNEMKFILNCFSKDSISPYLDFSLKILNCM